MQDIYSAFSSPLSQDDSTTTPQYWDQDIIDTSRVLEEGVIMATKDENGEVQVSASFSRMFFDKFSLGLYLNASSKKMLQLGAYSGEFLAEIKDRGWDVKGYDFSNEAIKWLTKREIPCQQVDLNNTPMATAYLKSDISSDPRPINFVAIRLLQYLEDKPLVALMHFLLNNAAQDSRYIIVSATSLENTSKALTKNYLSSFFGARTDMKFLLMTNTPERRPDLAPHLSHQDDSVIVVQKM